MQKVRCVDCGKTYDYDEDAFCPKCGAFNQPAGTERRTPTGRVDGLSEAGHHDSFLHKEFHEEERARRLIGLDKSADRPGKNRPVQKPASQSSRRSSQTKKKSLVAVIVWVIVAMMVFDVLGTLMFRLF